MARLLPLLLPLLAGCWKLDATTLDIEQVAFEPFDETAPGGWVIRSYKLDLLCPDGERADLYAVYPENFTGPQPVAVYFHSGSFDYITTPSETDPISGDHYAAPDLRLNREWSVRRVFATLGMFADNDAQETHSGALPVALAEQGVAMIMPANCWGDSWHNGASNPNAASEFFDRQGLDSASIALDVAMGVNGTGVSLPFLTDPDQLYLVGQGEGGRAATELLAQSPGAAGILMDSTADDLQIYWENPGVHASRITGLERIWTGGEGTTDAGTLFLAGNPNVPNNVAYIYSSLDSRVPVDSHAKALANIAAIPRVSLWERDIAQSRHVATAGDIILAQDAVQNGLLSN